MERNQGNGMEENDQDQATLQRAADAAALVEHGPAGERVDSRIDEGYLGHYESIEAFAQCFVNDNALKDRVEPSWMRTYVNFDLGRLARDLVFGLVVVKDPQGGVHVFDPSA